MATTRLFLAADTDEAKARSLEDHDGGGPGGRASGLRTGVAHEPEEDATDLTVEPLVVAEEDAERLGQGEDELPVG